MSIEEHFYMNTSGGKMVKEYIDQLQSENSKKLIELEDQMKMQMDELENKICIGELGLDGKIHPVNGTLVLAECGQKAGIKKAVVPKENAKEAACLQETVVYGTKTLKEIVELLNNPDRLEENRQAVLYETSDKEDDSLDYDELYGKERMKRAAMVA